MRWWRYPGEATIVTLLGAEGVRLRAEMYEQIRRDTAQMRSETGGVLICSSSRRMRAA